MLVGSRVEPNLSDTRGRSERGKNKFDVEPPSCWNCMIVVGARLISGSVTHFCRFQCPLMKAVYFPWYEPSGYQFNSQNKFPVVASTAAAAAEPDGLSAATVANDDDKSWEERREIPIIPQSFTPPHPETWLPDGHSQILRSYCVWPFGLLDSGSATLRCKI